MIIYGRRSIKEALQNNLDIQKVFVKKNAKNLEKIIFELNRKKIPISFVPFVKLNKLTKGNHQGVVCQVSPIKTKSLEDCLLLVLFVKDYSDINYELLSNFLSTFDLDTYNFDLLTK